MERGRIMDVGAGTDTTELDLTHFARQTLGDRMLQREILELFREHLGTCLGQLDAAPTPKDWRDSAHGLKGTARNVGAWGIGRLAEQAERLTGEDQADARSAALLELRQAAVAIEARIEALLADGLAEVPGATPSWRRPR